MSQTKEPHTTPPAADFVFSAMYHLSSLTYVDGVGFDRDPVGRRRALKHLESAKRYCDKAASILNEHE